MRSLPTSKADPAPAAAQAAAALTAAALAFLAFSLAFTDGAQAQRKPLVMEGKKTLFQKVVAHPGAFGRRNIGDPTGEPIKPFTILYVYEGKEDNGQQWFLCGEGTTGKDLAWVRGERVSEWKQSMVLLFDEKSGRQPLLFFKRKSDIQDIAGRPGIKGALEDLARQFRKYSDEQAEPPPDYPVRAMEPMDDQGAVPKGQFYIMPIFGYDDSLEVVKLLDVASINPGNEPDPLTDTLPNSPGGGGGYADVGPDGEVGPQKVAICFVIDTTMSMGPYIEASREVVRRFYDRVLAGSNAENTYLAFVAFRSSVAAAPGTEYTTKVIAGFTNATDRTTIEGAISQVKEAEASTHAFNEDSIAGINEALNLDWSRYGGGLIIVISDAGPLPRSDGNRASRDDPGSVKAKADSKGVRIAMLHLKTPAGGASNHRYAQGAYEQMAASAGGRRAYIGIDIPTPDAGPAAFAEVTDELVKAHEQMANDPNRDLPSDAVEPKAGETPQEQARNVGTLLGYSVRLDYLGAKNKAQPPSVVRSWIPDKDLGFLDSENPRDVRTVKVAVLLTKSQLSSLNQAVRSIIAGATEMLSGGSRDFFDAVMSAAVQVGRDPGEFSRNPARLSDSGLLGEYLEGLPYQSRVMTMNQEVWDAWTPNQQREFILELEGKVAQYEHFDSDVENWAQFGEQADGDWLYRVPLDALP